MLLYTDPRNARKYPPYAGGLTGTAQSGTILPGQGNGAFATGATLNTEFDISLTSTQTAYNHPVPVGIYAGDLNKDGQLGIALTSQSNTLTVAVYTGNGNGTLSNPKAFNIAGV